MSTYNTGLMRPPLSDGLAARGNTCAPGGLGIPWSTLSSRTGTVWSIKVTMIVFQQTPTLLRRIDCTPSVSAYLAVFPMISKPPLRSCHDY